MDNKAKIFIGIIVALVLGTVVTAAIRGMGGGTMADGQYDEFTTCLKDEGAVFYGAFWCPHCQSQKKMFGSSARLLPYVECSTADGRGQLPECREKGVTSYPTWEFADGSRLNGEIPLATLAEKTSCLLPGMGTESDTASVPAEGTTSPAEPAQ